MPALTPIAPRSDEETARLIRETLDFDVPPACLPGVRANLALLADHIRRRAGEEE